MLCCRRCGHPRDSHDECGRCHTTIVTAWNEQERRFTGQRPCECEAYQGPVPVKSSPDVCPHELQVEGPTPNKCVYCGKVVVKKGTH